MMHWPSILSVLALAASANAQCTSSPTKGLICGKAGSLAQPVVLPSSGSRGLAKDLMTCANACLTNAKCASFGFQQRKTCALYSSPIIKMGWKPSSASKTKYYARGCFHGAGCPTPPPPPPAGPLLNPGDFEDQSWGNYTAYSSDGVSTFTITSPGFESNYAGQISINQASGYLSLDVNPDGTPITVTPGLPYTFSFDLNVLDATCTLGVSQIFQIGGQYGQPVTAGTWAHYEQTIITSDTSKYIGFNFRCPYGATNAPNSPTWLIDNIYLTPVGQTTYSVSSTPTGPNVVPNSNFANQDFSDWTLYRDASPSFVAGPPGTDWAVQLTATTDFPYSNDLTSAGLPTVKDTIYVASFDYYYTSDLGFSGSPFCGLNIFLQSPANTIQEFPTFTESYQMGPYNPGVGPGQWGTAQMLITGQSTSDYFYFYLSCDNGGTNTFYLTNISLEPLD